MSNAAPKTQDRSQNGGAALCSSDLLACGCDCINKLRARLKEHHKADVELELAMWLNMETMKSEAGLPPLKYSYMDGKKKRKSHVVFSFCPFCGRRAR